MEVKRWIIKVLSPAKKQMREIKDRRIQSRLAAALQRLEYAPYEQGKKLDNELVDYHSVRAVSQRYRIIYYLSDDFGVVFVIGMGIRKEGDKKDIYVQTKKLLRQGVFNLNIEIENAMNIQKKEPLHSISAIELPPSSELSSIIPQDLTTTEEA